MKSIFSGIFIVFLFVIHSMIMFVSLYELVKKAPTLANYVVFLFAFACFGICNDVTFAIVLGWPSRITYSCFQSYFHSSYYLYVALHALGVGYFMYLVSLATTQSEDLAFRIYIFYLIIDCGLFYATFRLLSSVIEDSEKGFAEEMRRKRGAKVNIQEGRLIKAHHAD